MSAQVEFPEQDNGWLLPSDEFMSGPVLTFEPEEYGSLDEYERQAIMRERGVAYDYSADEDCAFALFLVDNMPAANVNPFVMAQDGEVDEEAFAAQRFLRDYNLGSWLSSLPRRWPARIVGGVPA